MLSVISLDKDSLPPKPSILWESCCNMLRNKTNTVNEKLLQTKVKKWRLTVRVRYDFFFFQQHNIWYILARLHFLPPRDRVVPWLLPTKFKCFFEDEKSCIYVGSMPKCFLKKPGLWISRYSSMSASVCYLKLLRGWRESKKLFFKDCGIWLQSSFSLLLILSKQALGTSSTA